MNLKEAADAAKRHVTDAFAAENPQNVRLENWVYDDHMMVWSLTIGFTAVAQKGRNLKLVQVSEADKSVLSVRDA